MITILYPYRDRELSRVKRSLDSLSNQSRQDFKVLLVDYGSEFKMAESVERLLTAYDFANYFYSYHINRPWSRAKAVNIGLRLVTTSYVFVADVDMIFRDDFVEKLYQLKNPNQSIYFKVGFLKEHESKQVKSFDEYKIAFASEAGAQGLSLFPMEALKAIKGFDEFLHFWGAEDEDVHSRLQEYGLKVHFYDSEVLLLHQWHQSYRKSEQKRLTQDLQLSNITRINMQHQLHNKKTKRIIVNQSGWGTSITKEAFDQLNKQISPKEVLNNQQEIDHFLFYELPNFTAGVLNVNFREHHFKTTMKYKIKKIMGKSVPGYYSLKEINDKLLLHLISFYSDCNYSCKISDDLKAINLKIQKG
jgi:hypothetical protein